MPAKATVECWSEFDLLGATWIHIAGKVKHTGDAFGCLRRKNQRRTSSITPANQSGFFNLQYIHHRQHIRCHELIRIRSLVAGAAAVTTAVDYDGAIATIHQCWNLISPVAAVTESAMQQDHG